MLMMRVVPMRMNVSQHLVHVAVPMALGHVQPDAQRHQRACDTDGKRERFVLDDDRVERAEERRDRVIRAGARRAEVTQREHEQRETDAIAGESERQRRESRLQVRHVGAEVQREPEIHGTGHRTFRRCNDQRIAQRHLAREVVVERPARARGGDQRGALRQLDRFARCPCQHGSARDDRRHAECDPAVEILAKQIPRKERRQHRFEVQQQ